MDLARSIYHGKIFPDTSCSICWEEYSTKKANPCTLLVCGHLFHTTCLQSWMERRNVCPFCERRIITLEPTSKLIKEILVKITILFQALFILIAPFATYARIQKTWNYIKRNTQLEPLLKKGGSMPAEKFQEIVRNWEAVDSSYDNMRETASKIFIVAFITLGVCILLHSLTRKFCFPDAKKIDYRQLSAIKQKNH